MRPRVSAVAPAALLASFASLCLSGSARAEGEVTSDTVAQFYDVRSPTGETVLSRRRVTTTLGVGAFNLLGNERGSGQEHPPELLFRARLRYDSDYGADPASASPTSVDKLVPGFSRGPVDFTYGYVEGRRFLRGVLGFRVGRQLMTDALGWWSFDGADVKVTTPAQVALEAYAGLEVRGGLSFSGSAGRWEAGGVGRGDRTGYDASTYPGFLAAQVAPAFGVAVESAGLSWLSARLSYRRVYNTNEPFNGRPGDPLGAPPLVPGPRLSSERVGYAVTATASNLGALQAGLVYDAYAARLSNVYASAEVFVSKKAAISADFDYFRPSFDADSIFNFFAAEPTSDLGLRGHLDLSPRLSVSAGAHVRTLQTQSAPHLEGATQTLMTAGAIYPSNGVAFNEGGSLQARYRRLDTTAQLRATGNFGDGGERVGADVSVERVIETRYVLSGRVGAWQWEDKLRPDRSAVNLGATAGAGYRFGARSRATFELEHNHNRLAGHRLRFMLWLSVAVFP